jgi:hypothetical protein
MFAIDVMIYTGAANGFESIKFMIMIMIPTTDGTDK